MIAKFKMHSINSISVRVGIWSVRVLKGRFFKDSKYSVRVCISYNLQDCHCKGRGEGKGQKH